MIDQVKYRQITVVFRQMLSDGNFGNETSEVTLQEWVADQDGVDDEYVALALNKIARRIVVAQLEESPSLRIRQVVAQQVRSPDGRAVPITVDDEEPL